MIKLYKYQQDLLDKAKPSYMYITDTGTGKTVLALHHFNKFCKKGTNLLIVCPATKVKEQGWEREIQKMYGDNPKFKYTVISYDKFSNQLRKVKKYVDYFKLYGNVFTIFDEGHYIKNRQSARTKHIKKFIKYTMGDFILLTATPTPNGYIDYGSYLEMFKMVKSAYSFEEQYGVLDRRMLAVGIPVITSWKNTKDIDIMFNAITSRPLKKEQCLDLPKLMIKDLYFQKSKEYKVICKTFEKMPHLNIRPNVIDNEKVQDKLDERQKKASEKVKTSILKKISTLKEKYELDFYDKLKDSIISRQKLVTLLREYGNPIDKISYLKQFLQDTDNNVIIFYNYNSELELLAKMCDELKKTHNKTTYIINGFMFTKPSNDKIPSKNTITLVQLQSGSSAIELQYANLVFYFSATWTYQDYEQSLGRAYRIGQDKNVNVYRLIVQNSFEDRISKLLDNKEEFNAIKVIERDLIENDIKR